MLWFSGGVEGLAGIRPVTHSDDNRPRLLGAQSLTGCFFPERFTLVKDKVPGQIFCSPCPRFPLLSITIVLI